MPVPWLPPNLEEVVSKALVSRNLPVQVPADSTASILETPAWIDDSRIKSRKVSVQSGNRVTQRLDEDLVVSAESSIYDPITERYVFSRGVVAEYGFTTIRADRLEVDLRMREARALGKVAITDLEGDLSADDLKFSWNPESKWVEALNVRAYVHGVLIEAEKAVLKMTEPQEWEFFGARGGAGGRNRPLFEMRSRKITVRPERTARLENPTLFAGGTRLITIPTRTIDLNPRTEGLRLPAISMRRDAGLGVNWQSGFLLNSRTNLSVFAGVFPKQRPDFGAIVSRSLLPNDVSTGVIRPESELFERFRFGYLENVQIATPEAERANYSVIRKTVSLSTIFGQGAVGRGPLIPVDKPLEAAYEQTGALGKFAYRSQLRAQSIRERDGVLVGRTVAIGSLILPEVRINDRLRTISRVDSSVFLGSQSFGWARGIGGLVYEPFPQLRLTGGVFVSTELGDPQFQIDRLYGSDGWVARADLDLGSTQISYMTKWDRRLGNFDREYLISQAVGILQPFVLYRQFPGQYNIGVRLRLDDFFEVINPETFQQRRERAKERRVLSPVPNGTSSKRE